MSWDIKLAIALVVFLAGLASGVKIHAGLVAQRDLAAVNKQQSTARLQRQGSDGDGLAHALAVEKISTQLGAAREQIAQLSGRQCLDAGTVSMLNNIGADPVRTATGEPESAPAAASSGGGLRFATDRDVARGLAICRAEYAKAKDLVDQIQDIEERRNPVQTSAQP